MNEFIQWDGYKFGIGDKFRMPGDFQSIEILEMFEDQHTAYLVVKYGDNNPQLRLAKLFAHYVEKGWYMHVGIPLFKKGERFTHQLTNDTIIIQEVAEVIPDGGKRMYFAILLKNDGTFSYITVDEEYLINCIKVPVTTTNLLPEKTIEIGAVFPDVSYIVS